MPRIGDAPLAALVAVAHAAPAVAERVDLLLGEAEAFAAA